MGHHKYRPALPERGPELKFSFKHLDTANDKYSIDKCCVGFWGKLIEALVRYSGFTVDDFRNQDNTEGRHTHYFPDTSEPNGFTCLNDPDGLEMAAAWQIRLCPSIRTPPESAWRVHGILIESVFYVVWLDYDHLLYDNPKFGPGH